MPLVRWPKKALGNGISELVISNVIVAASSILLPQWLLDAINLQE